MSVRRLYMQFCLYSFRLRNKCGLGDIIMYAKLICDFNTGLLDRYFFKFYIIILTFDLGGEINGIKILSFKVCVFGRFDADLLW